MSQPNKKVKTDSDNSSPNLFSTENSSTTPFSLSRSQSFQYCNPSPLRLTSSMSNSSHLNGESQSTQNSLALFFNSIKLTEEKVLESFTLSAFNSQTSITLSVKEKDQNQQQMTLPHKEISIKSQNYQCISGSTLQERIQHEEESLDSAQKLLIIDCRYKYEYDAGHIKNAISLTTQNDLRELLEETKSQNQAPLIVVYCEFSQKRSPAIYDFIRKFDRQNNKYPNLDFPDLYLLEQGFEQFFHNFNNCCLGEYLPEKKGAARQVEEQKWNSKWSQKKPSNLILLKTIIDQDQLSFN